MAYTFVKANGGKIGNSICEDDQIETAKAIEKKAAEWDGVVDAVQDSSSRRERLEKRLIYLQDYLQKYDDVSEQIYNSFSKEIAEIEEKLGKLGG